MSLKSKIEAIIYATEEPVTLDQIVAVVAAEEGEEPKRAIKAAKMIFPNLGSSSIKRLSVSDEISNTSTSPFATLRRAAPT